jgi:tetratricopeptide (TPR) repeat protein
MDRVAQIKQLLVSSPDDIFLNYALAMEFMSIEDYPQAIHQLELVKSIQSDYLPLFYQLAKCYEASNNNPKAIETYEQGMSVAESKNERKTLNELRSALEELTF